MSRASADEASRYYDLPEARTFHVPHPSYEGWYANTRDRMGARMDLELPANEFTFVSFGSLQPYKGLSELIDAFAELDEPAAPPPISDWWARLLQKPTSSPSTKTGRIRVQSGR